MHISPKGLALVRSFEGCLKPSGDGHFKPYQCPADVLTIGWGHTNDHGRQFDQSARWTQAECDETLANDMVGFEAAVQRRVRVPLEQNEFDALVSFAFNCGEGNLAKSTLLKKLNKGDYTGAASEFGKWNRAAGRVLAGLTRRRAAEAAMFRGDGQHADRLAAEHDSTGEPSAQQVDAPTKSMATSKIGNTQIATGVAVAAGAAGQINDALTQANSVKQTAHDLGVLDVLDNLAHQPMFWVFLAIGVGCGLTWYWRRQHRQEGV